MDKLCAASGSAGALTTFYAYDSGAARSLVLANTAWYLTGSLAGAPVLMIDWDLESPGLQHLFGSAGERPGLLEFFEACRDRLASLAHGATADPDERARQVLAAVDWRAYIEPVDADRPLYLMRAGRGDDTYGERVAQLDWHALFQACPALLRQWRAQMVQAFRHVLVDAPGGRSAAVSVCTSLLPDRIVGLFTPAQRSLDGLCGVVRRAIAYRCSHEDEQRPLLLYPLPCAPAGAGSAGLAAWRRGRPGATGAGYQPVLERLMQASYGRTDVSLESYFDHVQLPQLDAGAGSGDAGRDMNRNMERDVDRDADRSGAGPALLAMLDWVGDGHFPWQSHTELMLLRSGHSGGPGGPHRQRDDAVLRHGHAQFTALRPLVRHDGRRVGTTAPALQPYVALAPL